MKWLVSALFILIASQSFAAEPFARVELEDKGEIVPGQQVRLDVTVFVPDFFTSPPQFPLFDLPNAVVTLPDERAQNSSETDGGIQYSGIRRVYAVVPEASGTFELPAVSIDLGYSLDGKSVRGRATLPAFKFEVAEASNPSVTMLAFAAKKLTLSQSFDRDPASLRAGEALVRTITIFAEDTQAMMVPAVQVGTVTGLNQYTGSPRIDDNVSVGRGETGSRRVETITYTAQTAGSFVIPEVSYLWYDTEARRLSSANLPKTLVSVAPASTSDQVIAPEVEAAPYADIATQVAVVPIAAVGAFLIVVWTAWRLRNRLYQTVERRLEAYRGSDRRTSSRLRATIRNGTPPEIEAALRIWSRRQGYPTLASWACQTPALDDQVEGLQRLLYAQAADVVLDRDVLARSVSSPSRRTTSRAARHYLPQLNPKG